ncbi:hypothetical protein RUND412_004720 [Rhizina undulata]
MNFKDFSAAAALLLWATVATASAIEGLPAAYSLLSRRADACTILSEALPGRVELPGTTLYAADNQYWANTSDVTPLCIVTPSSNSEVSTALKNLENCSEQFAIRSGGHSQIKGWSGTDTGVTMYLKNLNEVELLENNTLAKIGVGARWVNVYETLEDQGYTVTGGRSGDVGVGGYSLGGGISYYVLTAGLAVDNIVSYEVVLASGEIVTASPSSNPQLYFALKGGGNNFGIVTSITFRTIALHASHKIWGGSLITLESTFPTVLESLYNYIYQGSVENPETHVIISFGWDKLYNISLVSSVLFDQDPSVVDQGGPAIFKNFTALQNDTGSVFLDTIGVRSISNLAAEVAASGEGTRQEMRVITFENPDLDLLTKVVDLQQTAFKAVSPDIEGLSAFFNFMVLRVTDPIYGPNPLGLTSGVTYVVGLIYNEWTLATDDALVYATSQSLWNAIHSLAEEKGMVSPYLYMNYASSNQEVFESYGEDNLAKLQAIKKIYDKKDVFGTLVKGGFKLPSS